jgi:hypothetical protein
MTIHESFSLAAFERAQADSRDRALSDELQEAVLRELHAVLAPALDVIVVRLNEMGHNLRHYTPPSPGDVSYRDDSEGDRPYRCRLRLGVDIVVSVGFADALAPADASRDDLAK